MRTLHRTICHWLLERIALMPLLCLLGAVFLCASNTSGAPIKLRNSDAMEMLRGSVDDTIINVGNVRFDQGGAHLYCDSSVWIVDKRLYMWGNVQYREGGRMLTSDSLIYDLIDLVMYATGAVRLKDDESEIWGDSLSYVVADSTLYVTGDSVIIISTSDSMRAVAKEAFIDRSIQRLELLQDARIQLGYPDTTEAHTSSRTLSALYIRYEYATGTAVAQNDVVLLDGDSKATGDCAILERDPAKLRLYDNATLVWLQNHVSGEFITVRSVDGKPERVDVYGDAVALFAETDSTVRQVEVASELQTPDTALVTDSATQQTLPDTMNEPNIPDTSLTSHVEDSTIAEDTIAAEQSLSNANVTSKITGAHLAFHFDEGLLKRVDAFGQAYSFYTPATPPGASEITNTASGDSIQLYVEDNLLQKVNAYGSVVGDYIEDHSPRGIARDTLGAPAVDSIHYTGERITFDMKDSVITLAGEANVVQKPMSMLADSIIYQTGKRFVKAYAIKQEVTIDTSAIEYTGAEVTGDDVRRTGEDVSSDTESPARVNPDSSQSATDDFGVPYLGTVTLQDGGQNVDGAYIEFSLATRKGLIIQSRSEYESAYYTGGELFREKEDVFFVDGGTYTTCDYETPHFHFWSKHMKMIRGEKLIAKPVVFFIEKIPVFALPYYVFPLQKGRRSGILNFRFGNFNRGGRFLANLGYYWAASEYWDIQGWMDYYETSGPAFSAQTRYNKRYSFSGNVGASVAYTSSFNANAQEVKSTRWRINFNHRQTISPTFNLNASGNFLSDSKYFTDFTDNLNDRLNRTLRSQVNFSKRFGRASVNGSYIFDENLDGDKRKTTTFPNLTFSLPSVQIFGSAAPGEKEKWYHTIRSGYSSTLRHFSEGRDVVDSIAVTLSDTTVTFDTTLVTILDSAVSPPDSIGVDTTIDTISNISITTADTTLARSDRAYTTYRHGTSIGPNFTVFKYFPVALALRYNETWFNVDATDQSRDKSIQTNKIYHTYTGSASVNFSTHLYGTIYPNIFGLRGIRHEFVPSVAYSYTPNITFDQQTRDAASFVGAGTGTSRSQLVSFSFRNVFDVKVGSNEKPKKLTLLTLTSSLSYNPEATSRRWSALSTRFQSSIVRGVTMSGNMVHSFYENGGLQSLSVNTRFATNGDFGEFANYNPDLALPPATAPSSPSIGTPVQPAAIGGPITPGMSRNRTWNLTISHTYGQTKGSPTKLNFLRFGVNMQLTPNMTVAYSQSYDIENKNTVNRSLQIHRILHRWEGTFNWTPSGSNRGFSFRLNVIALPDIKFEKSLTSSFGRQLIQQ